MVEGTDIVIGRICSPECKGKIGAYQEASIHVDAR